jgi:long-chain acyl-CoA synthetase
VDVSKLVSNLGEIIDRNRDPGDVAVIEFDGEIERQWTYGDLVDRSDGVARALCARGLRCGARVAIVSANSFDYLCAFFGILKAGLVAVPVNYKFPPHLVRFVLDDCGAELVFCGRINRPAIPEEIPKVIFGPDFDHFLRPGTITSIRPDPEEMAMLLYTSGSTGKPKGVILSHRGQIWTVDTRVSDGPFSHDRFLIGAPLYHMNALALTFVVLRSHALMVLLPQFSALSYLRAIPRFRCTRLTAVPPMIALILQKEELIENTDFSTVKHLRMGSAPVSPALLEAIRGVLPHASVTNAYGTTEGGPVVFGPHPDGLPTPELSVGHPHSKVDLRLVGENGATDFGVLQLRSPAIMKGYLNRPDIAVPITADGFYVTGDVFRRAADLFYFFVGRADDMFVSGGENIFPSDVERMLESHPDVEQACVIPVEDAIKGQKPVAFIVSRGGGELTEASLKEFALKMAPAYQHPRSVWFLDKLPLASTNKIDRPALRALAQDLLSRGHAKLEAR